MYGCCMIMQERGCSKLTGSQARARCCKICTRALPRSCGAQQVDGQPGTREAPRQGLHSAQARQPQAQHQHHTPAQRFPASGAAINGLDTLPNL